MALNDGKTVDARPEIRTRTSRLLKRIRQKFEENNLNLIRATFIKKIQIQIFARIYRKTIQLSNPSKRSDTKSATENIFVYVIRGGGGQMVLIPV